MQERRTEAFYVKLRPSVRRAIEDDAAAKGQTLAVWMERMVQAALNDREEETEAARQA